MALDLNPRFRTKNVVAALVMVSVLLLTTGCGEEEVNQAGAGSSTGSDADSDKGADGSKGADGKDGDNAEGDKGNSDAAPLTGKDCLPGTWLVDNESFRKFMAELGGNFNIATSGDVTLTLRADGSAETSYDHWTHDVGANGGKAVVERHGVDQGTYSVAANGTMAMSDTTIGSVTKVTVTAGGQNIVQTVEPEPSVFSQATVTCSGDTLQITVDDFTALMYRKG